MKTLLAFLIFLSFDTYSQSYQEYTTDGDSLYQQFKINKAFSYYQKAYETKPLNYYSLLNIVKIYNAVGELKRKDHKPDEAKEAFNRAINYSQKFISSFPDSSLSYTYSAISYGNLARLTGGKERLNYAKKIEEYAKKAVQLDSSNAIPYIILGAYYREIAGLSWIERIFANILYGSVPDGTFEDSKKMLKKALSINPDIITANFQMALTYRALNNEEKEKEYFKKVLSLPLYDFRDPFLKERAERILKRINQNKS